MIKDYSGSHIILNGRNKIRSSKKKSSPALAASELFSLTQFMWRTIGAMLLITLIIGISSTVWYGLQVQVALDQIGQNRATKNELQNENRLLVAQRDLLLTQDEMEKAVYRLGLRVPSKNQLRYP